MGQGKKRDRETAKALAGTKAGSNGGEAEPTDFCARTHSVVVRLETGARPVVGSTVWLALGSPPRVIGKEAGLGTLDDPLANGLTRCLLEGFRFSGTIDWVDLEERRGQITVTGEEGA
jgi:hypothetical protein